MLQASSSSSTLNFSLEARRWQLVSVLMAFAALFDGHRRFM